MPASEPHDPTEPGLSPDATVRLSLSQGGPGDPGKTGEPIDPRATVPLRVGDHLSLDSTQRLPLGGLDRGPDHPAGQTQKITQPRVDEPPLRTQKVAVPAGAEGRTQPAPSPAPARKPSFGWKWPAALVGLAILAAVAYLLLPLATSPQASSAKAEAPAAAAAEKVSAEVQVYLDQAKAGDTHAMRTLGTWYYYGLNVPQDREKGLYWYRQAAAKGSDAARAELAKLEGGR